MKCEYLLERDYILICSDCTCGHFKFGTTLETDLETHGMFPCEGLGYGLAILANLKCQ